MSFPLRFGPCWLDSVLASGQSSLLFRAHPASGDIAEAARPLVLKVPFLYLQRSTGFRQIFQERMAALTEVQHAGLVPVEATGRAGGLAWAASPQVESWDASAALESIQRGGPRPSPRQTLTLGLKLCDALQALHGHATENGPLVHGELRPGKILFLSDGSPQLLVVSAVTAAAGERSSASSAERFAWRAPEQLLRQPETIRTDVRGLALILFVLVTGSNPFQRRTTARTCSAILQDQVLFEGDAQLSKELSALLRAAMSSDPERRPADMGALRQALQAELARLGGEEPWAPWLATLRQGWPAPDDDGRPNPERDALVARLVRDAPRAEGAETARAEPAPEPAVAPPPAPPLEPATQPTPAQALAPEVERGFESEPTVLFGGSPGRSEPAGFTLVPDDVEIESHRPVRIEQLAGRALPPLEEEPRTAEVERERTQESLFEPTSEWTAEASYEPTAERTSERTEDLPAPERRARRQAKMLGSGQVVDSSFVLVTDEPTANAGVVVAADAAGQKESLPERLRWPPTPTPLSEPEDDDFIPALSEEECLAELAREQAAREEDEEEIDEIATPIGEELPPLPLQPAVVQISRPGASARAEITHLPPLPETTGPMATLPTVVNQPSPTKAKAPPAVTPETSRAPEPVKAPPPARAPEPPKTPEPVRKAEPAKPPEPTRPPPEPPRRTEPPKTADPPPTTKPPAEPPKIHVRPPRPEGGGQKGVYAAVAVAFLLMLLVGLRMGGVIGGSEPKPTPERKTEDVKVEPPPSEPPPVVVPPEPPVTQPPEQPPPTDAGTITSPPVDDASAGQQQGELPTPPTGGGQADQRADAGTRTTGKGERTKPPDESAGPPGLVTLKADNGTETSINIRGTMRGTFGRPDASKVPGAGVNGGDQYVLTFQGVESQMKITRLNVQSPLVSSVQISSGPGTLTLMVNVAPGCNVIYDSIPGSTSFRIRVSKSG